MKSRVDLPPQPYKCRANGPQAKKVGNDCALPL